MFVQGLIAVVLLAPSALTASAASPRQFDLDCRGDMHSDVAKYDNRVHAVRFSIDLDRGLWCTVENCAKGDTMAVVEATEDRLVLTRSAVDGVSGSFEVDRKTGAYRQAIHSSTLNVDVAGTCQLVPFTPMKG